MSVVVCACCGEEVYLSERYTVNPLVGPLARVVERRNPIGGALHSATCTESPFTQTTRERALAQAHLVQADLEAQA